MLRSVDLPLPDGPSRTTSSRASQVEVDAAERLHLDLAHPVGLHERRCVDGGEARGVSHWCLCLTLALA